MTRRMTNTEAMELLETVFEVSPETITDWLIEGFVFGVVVDQATSDIESYLATKDESFEADSFQVHRDYWDDADLDGVRIVIKTEG